MSLPRSFAWLNAVLCYPEGNFGGNQLLDGSIGLSPPYQDVTIDLHVRTVTGFHQRFLLASPSPGIVHHLSGLILHARYPQLCHEQTGTHALRTWPFGVSPDRGCRGSSMLHSSTRVQENLLGPCYKTGPLHATSPSVSTKG